MGEFAELYPLDEPSRIRYEECVPRDRMTEIKRLMTEISSLNARILRNVYHSAWDPDLLRRLQHDLERKKRELRELRTLRAGEHRPARRIEDAYEPEEDAVNIDDTRSIANALYTQRPLIYQSDEWLAYRRVCVALGRLFSFELERRGGFDLVEFLRHCGLSLSEAEEIARHPGDFVRRSEEAQGPDHGGNE